MSKKRTDRELFEIAKGFNSRNALKKKQNGAYQALYSRNILDEACSHMAPSLTEAYSLEEFQKEALKYKTKMEFRKYNAGMYDSIYKRGLMDTVCGHMPKNTSHRKGEDHIGFKWHMDDLKIIANKYNKKIDFLKNDQRAYSAAFVKGCLDEICSHMEPTYNRWTDEQILKAFLSCSSRSEVQKRFSRAYQAARSKGKDFLNSVCSHMNSLNGTSIAEMEIFNIVKKIFPACLKFTDRKVNIPNKPHIKRFEIDIYIPTLNKGIEFDGTHWHSFEVMKKSKKQWPEEDILSYHQIKDSYFLSKGIEILHIKEEDWDLDKESCILQIEKFLEISKDKSEQKVA